MDASLGERMTPHRILQRFFGYDTFRHHQLDVIEEALAGRDVFVLMPTGSGKSICFQVPSLIRQGVGLVISPLIALMQDQVEALRMLGVCAAFLNSSLDAAEARDVTRAAVDGQFDLLYVAPERLMTTRTLALLARCELALFAIDEAHCVSQWGHDFRPDYLRIGELRRVLDVPLAAFTATGAWIRPGFCGLWEPISKRGPWSRGAPPSPSSWPRTCG